MRLAKLLAAKALAKLQLHVGACQASAEQALEQASSCHVSRIFNLLILCIKIDPQNASHKI
jgi:hypothetical protein